MRVRVSGVVLQGGVTSEVFFVISWRISAVKVGKGFAKICQLIIKETHLKTLILIAFSC